jgi:hypothetical protein
MSGDESGSENKKQRLPILAVSVFSAPSMGVD